MRVKVGMITLLVCVCICALIIGVCTAIDYGLENKKTVYDQFIVVKTIKRGFGQYVYICYDKYTNVMYYYIDDQLVPCYMSGGKIGIYPEDIPEE